MQNTILPFISTVALLSMTAAAPSVGLQGNGSVGTNYCVATLNSTGVPSQISGTGTSVLADNQITISATQLPPNRFGMLLNSRTPGFSSGPTGAFNICLGAVIGRFRGPGEVQNSGPAGRIDVAIDLTAIPTPAGFEVAMVGESWYFQLWHRDVNPFGPQANLTDGLMVTLR